MVPVIGRCHRRSAAPIRRGLPRRLYGCRRCAIWCSQRPARWVGVDRSYSAESALRCSQTILIVMSAHGCNANVALRLEPIAVPPFPRQSVTDRPGCACAHRQRLSPVRRPPPAPAAPQLTRRSGRPRVCSSTGQDLLDRAQPSAAGTVQLRRGTAPRVHSAAPYSHTTTPSRHPHFRGCWRLLACGPSAWAWRRAQRRGGTGRRAAAWRRA